MKLVKLFNKLSAVALAASLVVGFASCSTTTDDPFNPNAPLTLEEYVKSEIKKAIENGGAPAKPEDPSELEFESRTSLMDKIQLNNEKTEDAWGNGTKISSANPLQVSEGYGWDKENGQISLPFAYDAGYFGENTHIIIEADDSALNYNADAAIKIEFKVENPSTGHSNEMNITSKFKDGVAIIPISEIGFTDSCQFLLTFRAKGTVTIKNIDMAKAKGQSAPEPTPGEGEKPGAGENPAPGAGEEPTPTPDPEPTPEPEPTPDPKPTPAPGEEETPVKSIALVKNPYAADGALQTQVKIPSELTSLSVGDKVKVAFSGTADREIGNVELMIVDTTKEAGYWTALSETKKDTFSTEINFDFEFEITKAPIGTGADSMVLAINGLDSDEAATITCTSFSIEKNADKKPAGGENNAGAGESTSKTYGLCKKYTATTTKDIVAGDFAFVLQIDNDGEKSADGLKIDVTDFEMEVKVGNDEPFTYKSDKIAMIPNAYSNPKFEKTDCRFVLDKNKAIGKGTVITVQVKKATVSNKAKADSIIFVFNEDGANKTNPTWEQYVSAEDNYKPIFAAN